jgi:thiol:disulfide interchange protein DsbD
MDVVKGVLAAAMVALTLYYLQFIAPVPALPRLAGLAIAAIGLALVGASLRGSIAIRTVGALLAGGGLFLLLGVRAPEPTPMRWEHDVAAALTRAKAEHKPALIDFFATWCAACVELDEKTYSQPEVQSALAHTVTIKVDGTDETDAITSLYKQYDIKGLPTVVFITADGQVLATPRLTGFAPPAEFLSLFSQAH